MEPQNKRFPHKNAKKKKKIMVVLFWKTYTDVFNVIIIRRLSTTDLRTATICPVTRRTGLVRTLSANAKKTQADKYIVVKKLFIIKNTRFTTCCVTSSNHIHRVGINIQIRQLLDI